MPPPTLPQNPRAHVENFYQNSFKQLSSVQQKQVGLIVGAAVADAAARGMAGRTAEEVAMYEAEALAFEQEHEADMRSLTSASSLPSNKQREAPPVKKSVAAQENMSPLVFATAAADVRAAQAASDRPLRGGTTQPLLFHSFSHHLMYELLRAMSAARGDFPVHFVAQKWVATAEAVAAADGRVYAGEVGSLLHTLCTLLPIPTIYPYASDADMRAYVAPFVDALVQVAPPSAEAGDALVEWGPDVSPPEGLRGLTVREAQAAEQSLAKDMTLSALSAVIRFLQSNPDPERNAAFVAIPGTADIFTADSALFVPKTHNSLVPVPPPSCADMARRWAINEALYQRFLKTTTANAQASTRSTQGRGPLVLPHRAVLCDAGTLRESFTIVKGARSFAGGVVQAIRLGGPVCQRAMLVGAMLGAKLGARQVPLPWLSATVDHQPVSTMAIEVAQWAWNPPHH